MASTIVVPATNMLTDQVVPAITQAKTDVEALQARVAEHQADSAASDVAGLKADLNALLAALQAAGLMASA